MMRGSFSRFLSVMVLMSCLAACAVPAPPPAIMSTQSPVALRAMQIRAFDTTNKRKVTQAVIATLQDLGYTVEKIDYASGTISAAKLIQLRLTASVYPHGTNQMSVRANAMVKLPQASSQVDDPAFYQKLFFEPLSQALFLTALQVEEDPTAPPATVPPDIPSSKPSPPESKPDKT